MRRPPFRYIETANVVIEGVPADGMTIQAATGRVLGPLRGFVVDAAGEHIRYLVVRRSGLFATTRLLPFSAPRVNFDRRTIEVDVNDQELRQLRDFSPGALLA